LTSGEPLNRNVLAIEGVRGVEHLKWLARFEARFVAATTASGNKRFP
jgi:hypothetical protein